MTALQESLVSAAARMDKTDWENKLRNIEAAYRFEYGYKLLYCPWETIDHHKLVFLSLNPGTRTPHGCDPVEGTISDERGNSYEVEQFNSRSPISGQFLRMCEFLGVAPTEVLTGAVAPFRSQSWKALTDRQRDASLDFGRRFWGRALQSRPQNTGIIACSKRAANLVVSLLGANLEKELGTGWGHYRIRRFRTKEGRLIVGLPHLSRFKLFGRAESEPYLEAALEDLSLH